MLLVRLLVRCSSFLLLNCDRFMWLVIWVLLWLQMLFRKLCSWVIVVCVLSMFWILWFRFLVVQFRCIFRICLMFIWDGMFSGFSMMFMVLFEVMYGMFLIGIMLEIIFLLLWWFVILLFGWMWCFMVRNILIIFSMFGVRLLFVVILLCLLVK